MSVTRTPAIARTQAMLGLPDPDGTLPIHVDKIIASIDVEDYSRNRNWPLLEGGLARLDTRKVRNLNPDVADDFEYLKHIQAYHFRFKESCHFRNKAPWLSSTYDSADKFMYGQSEFISRDQIEAAFTALLRVDDTLSPGTYREVQMITQGGSHDLTNIGNFSKPAFLFSNVVPNLTLEELQTTSKYAMDLIYKACNGQQPSIEKITYHVGLETLMLHNAGNDAVTQLADNIMLALKEYRERPATPDESDDQEQAYEDPTYEYDPNDVSRDEEETQFKPNYYHLLEDHTDLIEIDEEPEPEPEPKPESKPDGLLSRLSNYLKNKTSTPLVGTYTYCLRCGSDLHNRNECDHRGFIECKRCLRRFTHVTMNCPYGGNNEKWLEDKRFENYTMNSEKDRARGRAPAPYVPLAFTDLTIKDHILESLEARNTMTKAREEAMAARILRNPDSFPTLSSATSAIPGGAQNLSASFWANKTSQLKLASNTYNQIKANPLPTNSGPTIGDGHGASTVTASPHQDTPVQAARGTALWPASNFAIQSSQPSGPTNATADPPLVGQANNTAALTPTQVSETSTRISSANGLEVGSIAEDDDFPELPAVGSNRGRAGYIGAGTYTGRGNLSRGRGRGTGRGINRGR